MKVFLSRSPEETIKFGEELGRELKGDEIIAFFGELGAGKTTLIKGIVSGFGIKREVRSPSFVMITEYEEGKKKVYHIDLYRIRDAREAKDIGLFDYLSASGVKLIEWAEKIEESLPKEARRITLNIVSEREREIIVN